ncbi:MAG: hypothetical protein A2538_02135 [Candidatus Magasanikbacteria bacterium RIFOXYD2_FULL_41_14]|uniref:Nudix hydrolase domain-containing protein n=1 Tax=Candidatus Magasanikbacteria bacterium RIFOXYD2_FULL_41_14 TaxID=1798709 RepID=A0A1F6PD85_9BACT|nr:MAG: hypothetical protein A2538_02135 [Candidatus Magasanikbacteria bacterium RIFOXYD2_FULL_41_14]
MKIPEQAKKVFNGVVFDVYQWDQKLYDNSNATFEMLKRPNTLSVIPTIENKIVIGSHEQPGLPPSYGFLGGRQDKDESPEQGAQRELLEEGGLMSENWELYNSFSPHAKLDWIVYYFIARDCKKTQEPNLDAGEKIKTFAVSFDELVDMVLGEKFYGTDFALHVAKLKIRNRLDDLRTLLFK